MNADVEAQRILKINYELLQILNEIRSENKTDEDWSLIESCDMFQSPKYCGGYDATERCFLFSYFDENEKEWWFEIKLLDIPLILSGEISSIVLLDPK
ncbi:hypothetical protein [Aliikangiella sp. G2MR2-5]|uniref:hypothetical protein n=1 Tax=Aliikangiella sp. G2MR2-5 TaxID=2788943 RepID=UPI0018AB7E53|nr:hypothetical protein [Aliikangiella sp. G2MR2-5]